MSKEPPNHTVLAICLGVLCRKYLQKFLTHTNDSRIYGGDDRIFFMLISGV